MFISKKDINNLEKKALINPNGIARIIIHDQFSKVQLMCIAFIQGKDTLQLQINAKDGSHS